MGIFMGVIITGKSRRSFAVVRLRSYAVSIYLERHNYNSTAVVREFEKN